MFAVNRSDTLAITHTVAFEGIEARRVEVQCAISPGLPGFTIVGLPNKAVSEAKERVRMALHALGIALPSKRITVNLSPADLPKEGSHFDLPIAIGLLASLDIIPRERAEETLSIGELALNGRLVPVLGALPAALCAGSHDIALLCPQICGSEAAWVETADIFGAESLADMINHLTDYAPLPPARPGEVAAPGTSKCLSEVKGQHRAKRALEIAAAGRHHLFMVGPPGAGKSMMAARLPGIMPPLTPDEALETSLVLSIAGQLQDGRISKDRPFRAPHHTASKAAIVGGGRNAGPGEISLAHNGVLFLDEFPEFPRGVLETLRQPIETGNVALSRANAHVHYPCRFLLIAAANPCRCGQLFTPGNACSRAPHCADDYLGKISAPLMDRFDLHLEIPMVDYRDLGTPEPTDTSAQIGKRVQAARAIQLKRFAHLAEKAIVNADAEGKLLEEIAAPDSEGQAFLEQAASTYGFTARGYHRTLRLARTIADLEASDQIVKRHIAEAVSFRVSPGKR